MLQASQGHPAHQSPPPPYPPASEYPHHRQAKAGQGGTVHTSRLFLLARALEDMLDDERLGADEIAVYVAIQRYTDATAHCRPAQGTLASKLGKSRPWVNARVKRLSECDYLESVNRFHAKGGQTSNLYYLPHLDTDVAMIARRPRGGHQDDNSRPDRDTPSHEHDTMNRTGSDFEEDISLSAQESGFFEKLCNGVGEKPTNTSAPNIQIRATSQYHLVPENWQPSDEDRIWATATRPDIPDLQAFTAKFIAKVNAGGGMTGPVWTKWRQWLAMEATPRRQRAKPQPIRPSHGHQPASAGTKRQETTNPSAPPNTPQYPPQSTSANSVAAHNDAILQEALDILNGYLAKPTTIEIVGEQAHDHDD